MKISSITYPDVNNGLGFRVTLWVQGCSHHCKGCHNKGTWDFKGGRDFTECDKKIIFDLLSKSYIRGITFSGGDPIDSYDDVLNFCKEIKKEFPSKDIWLYTGYKLEILMENKKDEILNYIDVLVDGEYEEINRDVSLAFRGSTNQRIFEKINNVFENVTLKYDKNI